MASKFSLFLALRYLKPKRTFVSIITLISVMGVTLGIAVLIVVISVMAGFEEKIKEVVLGFEPHIVLENTGEMNLPFPDEKPAVFEDIDDDGNVIPRSGIDPEADLSPAEREHRERLRAMKRASKWPVLKALLEGKDYIEEATPFTEGPVMMRATDPSGRQRQLAPMMRGLPAGEENYQIEKIRELMKPDPENPGKGGLGELILGGSTEFDGSTIVMSRTSARKLGIEIGDTVTILSPENIQIMLDQIMPIIDDRTMTAEEQKTRVDEISEGYRNPEFILTGMFDSLRYETFVIISLADGQELYDFDVSNDVHGLAIQTEDAYEAARVQALIEEEGLLPPNWKSETWMEKNQLWFEQIRNERAMMYFVLFFIVIVAAFSIMNTMITVTVQKRKEIGVMKALGARESQIVWVFLAQGMVVGLVGMLAGAIAGNLVLEFREPLRMFLAAMFGMQIFPEGLYGVPEIPAKRSLLDMSIICIGAFVLCTVAALVPAWFAARLDPAKALRE